MVALQDKLEEFLSRQDANFASLPAHFVKTANEERSVQKDYNGRQVLELLQNAADAAGVDGTRVLIDLQPTCLIVANTGTPLDWKGIESLVVAHNSPKQLDRNHFIGNRGLGFRSVLNWSNAPIVMSGEIELHFDSQYAAERVAKLRTKSLELDEVLKAYEAAHHPPLVPYLSYPKCISAQHADQGQERTDTDIARARALRRAGYDTIILLTFTEPDAYEQAAAQVAHLNEEIGLFIPQLTQLTIIVDDYRRDVSIQRNGHIVEISRGENTTRWTVRKERGRIPDSKLAPGQPQGLRYEVAVAIPDKNVPTGELWCYLPTAVRTNLPARLHATLDLTNNRKNLRDESGENRWILGRLAKLLVEVAAGLDVTEDPWARLALITPAEPHSAELDGLGFQNAVREAALAAELVPVRGSRPVKPAEAAFVRSKTDFTRWLPLAGFENVCPWRKSDQILAQLEHLDVPQLTATDLSARLTQHVEKYDISTRAGLILGLLKEPQLLTKPTPPLLILNPRDRAQGQTPTHLPPTGFDHTTLPAWAPIAFLDRALVSELARLSEVRTADGLARLLEPFGVQEYRSEAIASALVAGARGDPSFIRTRVPEMLKALHALWQIWKPSESARGLLLNIPLLDEHGEPRDASELYLGAPYAKGQLCAALLSWKGPSAFVATTEQLSLSGADAEEFVLWCGVAKYPRRSRRALQFLEGGSGFTEYQIESAGGEIRFGDLVYPASGGEVQYENFTVIDDLDGILANAQPEAILAWLHTERNDPHSNLARLQKEGDQDARMQLKVARKIRTAALVPRSYIHYRLRSQPWLRTSKSEPRRPTECIAGGEGEELADFLDTPHFQLQHPLLLDARIEQEDVHQELRKVGASPSISDLSADGIYRLIRRMEKTPLRDSDAARKLGDAIFGALVRKAQIQPNFNYSNPPQWFKDKAKANAVFAGSMQPFPIGATVYVNEHRLVRPLADLYPILVVTPGKFDPDMLSLLTGCKMLKFEALSWRPKDAKVRPQSEALNASLRENRENLARWMTSQEPPLDPTLLDDVDVLLCEKLTVATNVNDHEINIAWNAEDPPITEGRTIYVVAPSARDDAPPSAFAQLVVTALTARLGTEQIPTLNFLLTTILLVPSEHVGTVLESIVPPKARPPEAAPAPPPSLDNPQQQGIPDVPVTAPPPEPEEEPRTTHGNAEAPTSPPEPTPPTAVAGMEVIATHDFEPRATWVPTNDPEPPPPGLVDPNDIDRPPRDEPDDAEEESPDRTPNGHGGGPRHGGRRKGQRTKWKRLGKTRARLGQPRRRGSGKNWENFAFHFEKLKTRVPWAGASEYVGSDAIGCDIVSFASEEHRLSFVKALAAGQDPDYNLVVRFIEVKGAGGGDANIFPSGDQLRAAKRWGERYFLYVFQPSATPGLYALSEIQNPASQLVDIPGIVLSRTRRRVSTIRPPPEDATDE